MKPSVTDAPARRWVDGVLWLQVAEAARRLGVTRGRIYHLTSGGRLRTRAFDGLLYVRDQDVQLYAVARRETVNALNGAR